MFKSVRSENEIDNTRETSEKKKTKRKTNYHKTETDDCTSVESEVVD